MAKPRPRRWKRGPSALQREAMEIVNVITGGVEPQKDVIPEGFIRQGSTRPRITIDRQFGPVLTERQRTIVKRRYRHRGAAAWGRMFQIMEKAPMTQEEFVATLSNEELARGQLKDKNGTFRGAPPAWVPREFHRACLKELMKRGATLWRENYVEAIEVMTKIAKGEGPGVKASPRERIAAAQYVIERLEGKVPEKINVTVDAPWEGLISGIVADVSEEQIAAARSALAGAQEDAMIIDAEVIEEPEPQPARVATRRRRRSS